MESNIKMEHIDIILKINRIRRSIQNKYDSMFSILIKHL